MKKYSLPRKAVRSIIPNDYPFLLDAIKQHQTPISVSEYQLIRTTTRQFHSVPHIIEQVESYLSLEITTLNPSQKRSWK